MDAQCSYAARNVWKMLYIIVQLSLDCPNSFLWVCPDSARELLSCQPLFEFQLLRDCSWFLQIQAHNVMHS